jgi:hypothetical protein
MFFSKKTGTFSATVAISTLAIVVYLAPAPLSAGQIPGDCNQDGRLDMLDAFCLLDHLFQGSSAFPCGDGTRADGGNVLLLDWSGDGAVDISDAVRLLSHLFGGGPPHPLGSDCVEIAGCPSTCGASNPSTELFAPPPGEPRTMRKVLVELPRPYGLSEVWCEEIDGYAVAQGDIVLGKMDDIVREMDRRAGDETGGGGNVSIKGWNHLWEDGIVPFVIQPIAWGKSSSIMTQRINDAIAEWEDHTDINFVAATPDDLDAVVFTITTEDCSSELGRIGGWQFIKLSTECTTGNVMHEIGHTLGAWHEQARCDRDSHVEILWGNIEPEKDPQFYIQCAEGIDIGEYDFDSIMHYWNNEFGIKDPKTGIRRVTIRSKNGETFGQRDHLSQGDIDGIQLLYFGCIAWGEIGVAYKVLGMAGAGGKIFCVTSENKLWSRNAVGSGAAWTYIGPANNVVALAATESGKLYGATRANQLWMRPGTGANLPWFPLGHANNTVAMTAIGEWLFAATSDNGLWMRPTFGAYNCNWTPMGPANNVKGLAAINGKLFIATSYNNLKWRDPYRAGDPWEYIGHANYVVGMTATNGKLFCATSDNKLWWRDPLEWFW